MMSNTSREETGLRALRYFASFAFNVSLFCERIPCAKLAKYRKARGVGWFLLRAVLTCRLKGLVLRESIMNKITSRISYRTLRYSSVITVIVAVVMMLTAGMTHAQTINQTINIERVVADLEP